MTIYTVSPSNFEITRDYVSDVMEATVGDTSFINANLLLKPKSIGKPVKKFVQYGLTLPVGTLESLTFDCTAVNGAFLTEILIYQINKTGTSRLLFAANDIPRDTYQRSKTIDIGKSFSGSLDVMVAVQFTRMDQSVILGSLALDVTPAQTTSEQEALHAASAGITSRSALADHYELSGGALSPLVPKYRTTLSLPMMVRSVLVSSDQTVNIRSAQRQYELKAGQWTRMEPNALSKLMIIFDTQGISAPPLFVRTDQMSEDEFYISYADHEAHRKLADLAPGSFYAAREELELNPRLSKEHVEHVQRAVQDVIRLVKYSYNPMRHGVSHGRRIVPEGMSSTHWLLDISADGASYQTLTADQVNAINAGARWVDTSRARTGDDLESTITSVLQGFTKLVVHTVTRADSAIASTLETGVDTVQQVGEDLVHGDVAGAAKDLWGGTSNLGADLVQGGEYLNREIVGFTEHAAVVTLHSAEGATQFMLHHTGMVGTVLEHVLKKAGHEAHAVIVHLLNWLKDKLHWSDVIETQQHLSDKFDGALTYMQARLQHLKQVSDARFSRLEAEIDRIGIAAVREFSAQAPAHAAHHARHSRHLEKAEWLFSSLVESLDATAKPPPPMSAGMSVFFDSVADKFTPKVVSDSLGKRALATLKGVSAPSVSREATIGTVMATVKELLIDALKAINALEDDVLDVESWLFGEIRQFADHPVDSPLINAIWNANGGNSASLRVVDLVALVIALPLTEICWDLANGPPFQSANQRTRSTTRSGLSGDPERQQSLLPQDGAIRDWGIAYGAIHLVLGATSLAGRYRELSDQENSAVDYVLAAFSIVCGALSQVAGSPIGVPMDINETPPDTTKADVLEAPNYWANMTWLYQWIIFAFDSLITLGGFTSRASLPFIEGKDVVMFVLGIPHVALMGVLDQADRAKMEQLRALTADEWNENDLELFALLQSRVSSAYSQVRQAWPDDEKTAWVQAIRNYDAWAKNGALPGIPEKGFGNVADALPEIGSLGYFEPIKDSPSGVVSLPVGLLLDVLGHFGEALTYLTRARNNRLL